MMRLETWQNSHRVDVSGGYLSAGYVEGAKWRHHARSASTMASLNTEAGASSLIFVMILSVLVGVATVTVSSTVKNRVNLDAMQRKKTSAQLFDKSAIAISAKLIADGILVTDPTATTNPNATFSLKSGYTPSSTAIWSYTPPTTSATGQAQLQYSFCDPYHLTATQLATMYSSTGVAAFPTSTSNPCSATQVSTANLDVKKMAAQAYQVTAKSSSQALKAAVTVPCFDSGNTVNEGILTMTPAITESGGSLFVPDYQYTSSSQTLAVSKFDTQARFDQTFGTGGQAQVAIPYSGGYYSGYFSRVYTQSDGSMFGGGWLVNLNSDFAVYHLTNGGNIDTSFGTSGFSTANFQTYTVGAGPTRNSADMANTMFVQADGKPVVVGYPSLVAGTQYISDPSFLGQNVIGVTRFTTTGALDTTFGSFSDGKFVFYLGQNIQLSGTAVAQENSGKLIVAGTYTDVSVMPFVSNPLVLRLNQDGTLDTSFNGSGYLVLPADAGESLPGIISDLAVLNSGKIYATFPVSCTNRSLGCSGQKLYRIKSNGHLDTSFQGTGYLPLSAIAPISYAIMRLDNNQNLVFNYMTSTLPSKFGFTRLDSTGTLDKSFGKSGFWYFDVNQDGAGFPSDMTFTTDGRIVSASGMWNPVTSQNELVLRCVWQ